VVSTGNEADLDFSDFVRYLLDDPDTKVIAGFVEGFKDARKFVEVAKLAAKRGKPVVLIKIGRSESGSRAARSHTAALTGVDAVYDTAMAQYGVIRVQDYDELLEVSQLLAQCPKPSKPGIAVVSHSGGISSLTADMCGQAGLELPPLTDRSRDGINNVLKGFGWAANPADVTGFAMGESFPEIMSYMADQPEVGSLVVASAGADSQAEQVIAQRDRLSEAPEGQAKGLAFLWTGSRQATSGLTKLKEAQIPIFYTPNRLASGLRALQDYYFWRDHRGGEGFPTTSGLTEQQQHTLNQLKGLPRQTLSEHESKRLVSAWGVTVTREDIAASSQDAVAAARTLGYPVALKLDSPEFPHKTEAGVIRLGLNDDGSVREAYDELMSIANRSLGDSTAINGVLVQEMVSDAVEVIVGVSYDSQLGPVLLFGLGGVMVEVYQDTAFRLCPISRSEAVEMIQEVKGSKLLQGFRGRPPADVGALAETLVQVSHLAVQLEGELAELDVNPLMVLPSGQGVKAADALAVFQP
jgi:acetyltransferase